MKLKITSFVLLLSLLFGVVVPVEGKLTEDGKKWIAQNLGKKVGNKYCFDYNITYYWYDPDEKIEKKRGYGTAGMMSVLIVAKLVGKADIVYVRIGDKKFYYSDLKAGNDGYDVTLDDVKYEIVPYDGYPAGENQYCFTPTTPTTPTEPTEPTTPTTPTGLTENGKRWIARNFGVKVDDKYCYSYDAPTFYWYDPDTGTEKTDRGTWKAARTLVAAKMAGVENTVYVRIGDRKYYYRDLVAGNDGKDVTLDDLDFVLNNDGYPAGEPQYCYTPSAPTLSPAPTPTSTRTPTPVTLTEECKQYIARYLGEKVGDKYCFTDSTAKKVKYWTATNEEQLGSTLDAVVTIVLFGGYSYEDPVNRVGKITADTLKQKNGGVALTDDDIEWIKDHSDGANKYCFTPEAEEPPDAIKEYIVKNYGDGRCILSDTGRRLGAACMLEEANPGTGLARPLPEGYDVDDICSESTITWAYDNVGWCLTAPTSTLQTTETLTQTKTTPPTPGFEAILAAIIIALFLITRRYD